MKIEEVKHVIDGLLPECWLPLEACLSLIGAALLKDVDHCIGLILVGEPGGRKTTTLSLLGKEPPFVVLDNFTPASFVSHDATKSEEQLKKIDLLPQINHKVLVVPELAPMFGQRYEDLVNDIAILTRIMDGSGYTSASGIHGLRGYSGDYRFGMIAATIPLEQRAWQALGRLSSRWVFYRLESTTGKSIDLAKDFSSKRAACAAIVQDFLKGIWGDFGTVEWNRDNDPTGDLGVLTWNAIVVSRWRGIIQKQDYTGYNPPIIEAPFRLAETLYALARGHALIYGRKQLGVEDVIFALNLNFTNMPEDRIRIFSAFKEDGEKLRDLIESGKPLPPPGIGLREAARALGCSVDKAGRVLSELEDLGVLEKDKEGRYFRKWVF